LVYYVIGFGGTVAGVSTVSLGLVSLHVARSASSQRATLALHVASLAAVEALDVLILLLLGYYG
jgi:hypothetical protein